MPPPRGGARQPDQAGGLGGDAVDRDELLLLADGVEEAERVRAESDQPHERQRDKARGGGGDHARAIARAVPAEREERQQQGRAHLDAHTCDQCGRGGAGPGGVRAGAPARGGRSRVRGGRGREPQGEREAQQQQRVVVGAADGEREQHRVQADERRRPAWRVSAALGAARDQRDRREAGERRERFVYPHVGGDAQRRQRVAEQREQRSVRRMLERPAEEVERRVGGRFRGEVRVRVQAVQGAHATERDVAEHVL